MKTVEVPVKELEKLEKSRVNLYEFLEDKLTEEEINCLPMFTEQICKVANRINWDNKKDK